MNNDWITLEDAAVKAFLSRLLQGPPPMASEGDCVPAGTDVVLQRRDGKCLVQYKLPRSEYIESAELDDTGYFQFEKLVTLRDGKFETLGQRFFKFESDSGTTLVRCTFVIDDGSGPRVFEQIAPPEFIFRTVACS